jgi:uncharacterized phage protein (predicted DNA packaging)
MLEEMLDDVKTYLRIDGTEDDVFLSSLISGAKLFINNATGKTVNESNDLHKLAVSLLCSHWYENREVVGKADKLAFSLDSILFQISFESSDTV